jgi:hypothetical protein
LQATKLTKYFLAGVFEGKATYKIAGHFGFSNLSYHQSAWCIGRLREKIKVAIGNICHWDLFLEEYLIWRKREKSIWKDQYDEKECIRRRAGGVCSGYVGCFLSIPLCKSQELNYFVATAMTIASVVIPRWISWEASSVRIRNILFLNLFLLISLSIYNIISTGKRKQIANT